MSAKLVCGKYGTFKIPEYKEILLSWISAKTFFTVRVRYLLLMARIIFFFFFPSSAFEVL